MIEQGTPEWHAARCGRVTASRVADMLARTKTGWGASRHNYRAQLVAERLTGIVSDGYVSPAMQWGTDTEASARTVYEMLAGASVAPGGFVAHPTIEMAGCSPDGFVGDHGLVEIKCPNTATHIETLRGRSIPEKYVLQMQFQMACTERAWCDFVSYDPRMPDDMRLFVRRLDRDIDRIAELQAEVVMFLAEVDAAVSELTSLYRQPQAAE